MAQDLTLAEVRTLRARQRLYARDQSYNDVRLYSLLLYSNVFSAVSAMQGTRMSRHARLLEPLNFMCAPIASTAHKSTYIEDMHRPRLLASADVQDHHAGGIP